MIEVVGAEAANELAQVHALAFERPWRRDELFKMFENPAVMALAARESGIRIIGFVLLWAAGGDAEILTLAVRPQTRRRGVAAALVNAAGAAALARGSASMHLDVAEDNAAARALYEKLGYREAGRRRGYYTRANGSIDAVVMRLALEAGRP